MGSTISANTIKEIDDLFKIMVGQRDEYIDLIMAIENVGHELKRRNDIESLKGKIMTDLHDEIELIRLALQGVYK